MAVVETKPRPPRDERPLFAPGRAREVAAAFAAAIGGGEASALRLSLYESYALLEAWSGGKTGLIEYRGGEVRRRTLPTFASGAAAADLRFDFDEVAFDRIPGVVERTLAEAGEDGSAVTHVIVARPLPFSRDVEIRAFWSGPGGSGRVDFDRAGNLRKVVR